MKAILQLVVTFEDGTNTVKEIANINRTTLTTSTLGMSLEESKQITNKLQAHIIEEQVKDFVKDCKICPTCAKSRNIKGYCNMVYRTMFGKMHLKSPRLVNCGCNGHTKTSSPLSEILVNRISPELEYIEAKWPSLMSYGMSTKLLADILPVKINSCSAFITIQKVANKIEAELGTEQGSFINMCPYQIENLPTPDLPLEVKIDGGYIHARDGSNRKAGWFEAIVGKSIHPNHATKRFAYVTTYDKKPKRRLHEMLLSQGMQLNQQITFFSDGDEKLKDLQYLLSPDSEHVLDWFHITMRLTVLQNMSNSINKKLKIDAPALLDKIK